jgi:hypothetical protein
MKIFRFVCLIGILSLTPLINAVMMLPGGGQSNWVYKQPRITTSDLPPLFTCLGVLLNPNAQPAAIDTAISNAVSHINNSLYDLSITASAIQIESCSQQDFNTFVSNLLLAITHGFDVLVFNTANQSAEATSLVQNFQRQLSLQAVGRGNQTNTRASLQWKGMNGSSDGSNVRWKDGIGYSVFHPDIIDPIVSVVAAALGTLVDQSPTSGYENVILQGLKAIKDNFNPNKGSYPKFKDQDITLDIIDNFSSDAIQTLGLYFITAILKLLVSKNNAFGPETKFQGTGAQTQRNWGSLLQNAQHLKNINPQLNF